MSSPVTEAAVINALPSWDCFLNRYVSYSKHLTDAPLGYALANGITMLAQSVPISLTLQRQHAALFTVLIGESTNNRKTTSISAATEILQAADPTQGRNQIPASHEALCDMIEDTPRMLLVFNEFGSHLAKTSGMTYLSAIRETMTELYDGVFSQRRKAGKKKAAPAKLVNHAPRLSLIGGSTLPFLEDFTDAKDWLGGYMPRFFFMAAERERSHMMMQDDPTAAAQLVIDLQALFAANLNPGRCVGLEASAAQYYGEWQSSIFAALETQQVPVYAVASIKRSLEFVFKFALTLAWSDGFGHDGNPWQMPLRYIEVGTRIAGLHQASVLHITNDIVQSYDMKLQRDVLRAIPKDGYVSLGEISRRAGLTLYRLKPFLETLLEQNRVERHQVSVGEPFSYTRLS